MNADLDCLTEQGDKELEKGLPVTALFDRTKPGASKAQVCVCIHKGGREQNREHVLPSILTPPPQLRRLAEWTSLRYLSSAHS